MKSLLRSSLRLIDRLSPPETVSAHCDIPGGIYEPHLAQTGAQTVVRVTPRPRPLGAPGRVRGGSQAARTPSPPPPPGGRGHYTVPIRPLRTAAAMRLPPPSGGRVGEGGRRIRLQIHAGPTPHTIPVEAGETLPRNR